MTRQACESHGWEHCLLQMPWNLTASYHVRSTPSTSHCKTRRQPACGLSALALAPGWPHRTQARSNNSGSTALLLTACMHLSYVRAQRSNTRHAAGTRKQSQ